MCQGRDISTTAKTVGVDTAKEAVTTMNTLRNVFQNSGGLSHLIRGGLGARLRLSGFNKLMPVPS